MCGIAVIRRFDDARVDAAELEAMLEGIAHRGPDDAGYALLDEGRLGLAQVRLSILDLANGDQPIFDPERGTAIVFNGELYDHVALRAELEARGHRFYTTTDTEVLLHLYGEYGLDFVDRLNGEFSFVIWDERRRRIVAVRDPVGVKPLFFRATADEILFGSELKALFALPRVPRAISNEYLTGAFLGICPETACAFDGVEAVPPGTALVVEANGTRRQYRYWRPPLGDVDRSLSDEETRAELRLRMTRAVRRRLTADVPVNVYLSGGFDSTLVLALMTSLGARPTAYHIAFPGSEFDESREAGEIAAHYGVDLDVMPCTMERMADVVEETVGHVEGAVANLNSAAKLLLSRHVRARGTKVCLTGEGADESFAGYPYFKLEALWRLIERGGDDAVRGRALFARFREMESRSEGILWDARDRWRRAEQPYGYPCHLQVRVDELTSLARLMFDGRALGLGTHHAPPAMLRRAFPPDELSRLEPMNAARTMAFHALSGYIIPSLGDRVEMANSVECRTPFLDREVVDFACRLPPERLLDLDRLREKLILHQTFADLLPPVVTRRHKHPLLAPSWRQLAATRVGRQLVGDHLSAAAVRGAGMFRPGFVSTVRALWQLAPATSGLAKRLDLAIGALLTTQILHDRFVARRAWPTRALRMIRREPLSRGSRLQAGGHGGQ
ncbi:MAG: Asparagine synthetase [Myxococcales bacterium]|nr:Asparagine synthetase [Myxococcales bacterium]